MDCNAIATSSGNIWNSNLFNCKIAAPFFYFILFHFILFYFHFFNKCKIILHVACVLYLWLSWIAIAQQLLAATFSFKLTGLLYSGLDCCCSERSKVMITFEQSADIAAAAAVPAPQSVTHCRSVSSPQRSHLSSGTRYKYFVLNCLQISIRTLDF